MLDLKVPPLVVLLVFAGAAGGFAFAFSEGRFYFIGQDAVAVGLAIAGVVFAAAGVLEFRRAKTTVNPLTPAAASSMVCSGVFRYSRNPMYVGMALALSALVVWMGSVIALLAVPGFCAYITEFQIKPEGRFLESAFGARYHEYMSRVRRWL